MAARTCDPTVLFCGFRRIDEIAEYFKEKSLKLGEQLYAGRHVFGVKEEVLHSTAPSEVVGKCLAQMKSAVYNVRLQVSVPPGSVSRTPPPLLICCCSDFSVQPCITHIFYFFLLRQFLAHPRLIVGASCTCKAGVRGWCKHGAVCLCRHIAYLCSCVSVVTLHLALYDEGKIVGM